MNRTHSWEENRSYDSSLDLIIWGSSNLESPASLVDPSLRGGLIIPVLPSRSAVDRPIGSSSNLTVSAIVPFHIRYLPPISSTLDGIISTTAINMKRYVEIQPPSLVKFCEKDVGLIQSYRSSPQPISMEQMAKLMHPGDLFSQNVLTLNMDPFKQTENPIRIPVPVGRQDDQITVEWLTALTIWLAFGWIVYCIIRFDYFRCPTQPTQKSCTKSDS